MGQNGLHRIIKGIIAFHFWSGSKSFAAFLTYQHHRNHTHLYKSFVKQKATTTTRSLEMHHLQWKSEKDQRWNWDDNRSYNIIILSTNVCECKCKCNAIQRIGYLGHERAEISLYVCAFRRNYSSHVCMRMCEWVSERRREQQTEKWWQAHENGYIPFTFVRCLDLKMDDRLILKTVNLSEVCSCVCEEFTVTEMKTLVLYSNGP